MDVKFQVGQRVWFRSIGHKTDKKFRAVIVKTYSDGSYDVEDETGRGIRNIKGDRLNPQEVPKGEVFA